jgi:hydrogenase-4 component F
MLSIFLIIPITLAMITLFTHKKHVSLLSSLAIVSSAAVFLFALETVPIVSLGERIDGVGPISGFLFLDALGAVLLLIISFIGFAAALYSKGYLAAEMKKGIIGRARVKQFYVFFHLFTFAMLFSVLASNPIVMWGAIEATTLSTAFLISFYNKPSATEAAWKYLIINSIGLLVGFFGTLTLLSLAYTGVTDASITWKDLLSRAGTLDPFAVKIAFIFIFVGYGTKAGFVPMHTWLPDAHGKAPAPISALLSGVLLNTAFLAILRFKQVADLSAGQAFTSHLFILFGCISILIMAFTLLFQRNYKRLLAYSSIENMGIMALGFGFGGVGIFGAILHMIYHAIVKSALFFSAGNLLLKYSTTKIKHVSGALAVLPVTAPLFFALMFAITGVPPFGTFLSKFSILSSGAHEHHLLVLMLAPLFGLVFIGFLGNFTAMIFGHKAESMEGETLPKGESGVFTILPIVMLLVTLIALSIHLPAVLYDLIQTAASGFTIIQ